jgi:hypothetical protein
MTHLDTVAWSKIGSMAIFLPIYLGALAYVFYRPNRARLEAHAHIPLLDD